MSMSNLHHLFVLIFCIYNLRHACDDNSDYPVTHDEPYYRWIYSDQCFMQPYEGFGILLTITLGYLVMDLTALVFYYEEWTSVRKQTIAHHALAITGFLLAFVGGFGLPGIAQSSLITEISSMFLNYRHYFNNQKEMKVAGMINQIIFFITFTVTRMLWAPYLLYLGYLDVFAAWNLRTSF